MRDLMSISSASLQMANLRKNLRRHIHGCDIPGCLDRPEFFGDDLLGACATHKEEVLGRHARSIALEDLRGVSLPAWYSLAEQYPSLFHA